MVSICQDYYYKSFDTLSYEERKLLNFDHPKSFDNDLMIEQIKALKESQKIDRPVYSFIEYKRLPETIIEEPKPVIVIEGILIFEDPKLVDLMDIKVFVETDADTRFARRLMRDIHERGRNIDSVINQYFSTVKPMHEAFVEPSKKHADIIVPNGGLNEVASSMIIEKLKAYLAMTSEDSFKRYLTAIINYNNILDKAISHLYNRKVACASSSAG